MLSKELVAASTKPMVLALLAERESYGYELIQRIAERSGGRVQWSEGMLYPFLHWMEAEGLITSEWRVSENGRRRRYYVLSPDGRRSLLSEKEQWMAVHTTLEQLWKPLPHSI